MRAPKTSYQPLRGFSLAETLVAMAILAFIIVAPMTMISQVLLYARLNSDQNTAYFLAQEGIEALHKLRADAGLDFLRNVTGVSSSWEWVDPTGSLEECFQSTGCGIDWENDTITVDATCANAGECVLNYHDQDLRARYIHKSGGTASLFTRVIKLAQVSGTDAISVLSEVSWEDRGTTHNVVLQTYLHDIYDY